MLTATRNGARARAINGDRDRAKSGLKLVFRVHLSSKSVATSTSGRAYGNYTIFEGTSEIQRLIISSDLGRAHPVVRGSTQSTAASRESTNQPCSRVRKY
jgi:hypothetical protein